MPIFKTAQSEAMAQYILFTILVVLTPFIVVTRYLQGVVHIFSHLSFSVFNFDVPYILVIALAGIIFLLIKYVKFLTRRKLLGLLFIAALLSIAHQTMDLYLQMSFFDLQQNWHYVAYSAYAFFFFRAFRFRNMPLNKMIIFTYLSAIGMSVFDEAFQFFMSDRVFDISDIAKDSLGVYCGLILIIFVTETYGSIDFNRSDFTHRRLTDYFLHPLSLLVTAGVLTLSFIFISPLLTAHDNWQYCLLGGFGLFVIVMLTIHLMQFRKIRIVLISIILLIIILLCGSFTMNFNQNISHAAFGFTVYKGVPVPFFDVLIYPGGCFRLVDKKHHFNEKDINYFLQQSADIILVGKGYHGNGGKGFDIDIGTYFIFNQFTQKGTQVIILPTPEACEKFNQLREEGKSVLFVLHSTC